MEFSFDVRCKWMMKNGEVGNSSGEEQHVSNGEEKHVSNLVADAAANETATISATTSADQNHDQDQDDDDKIAAAAATDVKKPARENSDHAYYTMSSADELFQNGKIRPLYSIGMLHDSTSSPVPDSPCSYMSITVLQEPPTVEPVAHHVVDDHQHQHQSYISSYIHTPSFSHRPYIIPSAASCSSPPAENPGFAYYFADHDRISSRSHHSRPPSSDYHHYRPPPLYSDYPHSPSASASCPIPRPRKPSKLTCRHRPQSNYTQYDRPSPASYDFRPSRSRQQSQYCPATESKKGVRRIRPSYRCAGSRTLLGVASPRWERSQWVGSGNAMVMSRAEAPRVCTKVVCRACPKIFPLFHLNPTMEGTFTPIPKRPEQPFSPSSYNNDPLWESYLLDKPQNHHLPDEDHPHESKTPRTNRHRHRHRRLWILGCIKPPLHSCQQAPTPHHPSVPHSRRFLSFLIRCH